MTLDIEHVFDVRLRPMPPLSPAFADLRQRLDHRFREASPAAFTLAQEAVIRTGLHNLAPALCGGFPRGVIASLEGLLSSGRTAIAVRLLAAATERGLGAVVGQGLF